jgi:heat shock protein HslJ
MVQQFLLYFFILTSISLQASNYLKVMYIADSTTTCGDKKCMMYRNSPEENYQPLPTTIEGFIYKEGFEYCILVTAKTIDSTHTTYKLQEIKSKTKGVKTNKDTLHSTIFNDTTWLLYKLRMKDGNTRSFTLQKAYLKLDFYTHTITGNSDCNSISGEFTITDAAIKFENIVSSNAACGKHSIDKEFMQMFYTADKIKINGKLLYLTKGKMLLGLFTLKK